MEESIAVVEFSNKQNLRQHQIPAKNRCADKIAFVHTPGTKVHTASNTRTIVKNTSVEFYFQYHSNPKIYDVQVYTPGYHGTYRESHSHKTSALRTHYALCVRTHRTQCTTPYEVRRTHNTQGHTTAIINNNLYYTLTYAQSEMLICKLDVMLSVM